MLAGIGSKSFANCLEPESIVSSSASVLKAEDSGVDSGVLNDFGLVS
jgi:hypothetical protein